MSPTEIEELKFWLKSHKAHLQHGYDGTPYSPDEIAMYARMNGFSLASICRLIPEYHRDLQTHSTGKLREWWWVEREIEHIETSRRPRMDEQWHAYLEYCEGREWI